MDGSPYSHESRLTCVLAVSVAVSEAFLDVTAAARAEIVLLLQLSLAARTSERAGR